MSRDDVLAAALAHAAKHGIDAVSIRAVAGRLDVTPMALYRHVRSKEDLLDGMADLVYAELRLPAADGDWWDALAGLARSVRRLLRARPWAEPLFRRPLTGANQRALDDGLRETLLRAGFSAAEAKELHDQLSAVVFALIASSRSGAAFERGLAIVRAGLESRLRQQ